MQAEWKRVRCQETLYKNKETIQNTLQKQRAHQGLDKVLNEKQQAENRKYGSNMREVLQKDQFMCAHVVSKYGLNMVFVNVPVDIAPTVNTLPRSLNDAEIITIKFKRKKQYKNMNSRKQSNLWLCEHL